MTANAPKRNATQRIEDLERAVMAYYQTGDNMARDLMTAKEAIKLLGNKCDALQKAAGISDEQVAALMIQNNVDELAERVTNMVSQRILVATDVVEGPSNFVVGKELNDDDTVANPRVQFAMSSINEELQSKILGSKPGDKLSLQEGKLRLEVIEVYRIQNPDAESAPETEDTATASNE